MGWSCWYLGILALVGEGAIEGEGFKVKRNVKLWIERR